MKIKELILATSNPGKIAELQAMLSPICCIPQNQLGIDDAIENGLSFIENAILKARYASEQSNKAALADDSGLVIPALSGEPGIYSARYAKLNASDDENIDFLLAKLAKLPAKQYKAYYYCVLILFRYPKDPTPILATGKLMGTIITSRQGTQGFGYDPIFYLPKFQCTVAQLAIDVKNKISHRALALQKLLSEISMEIQEIT